MPAFVAKRAKDGTPLVIGYVRPHPRPCSACGVLVMQEDEQDIYDAAGFDGRRWLHYCEAVALPVNERGWAEVQAALGQVLGQVRLSDEEEGRRGFAKQPRITELWSR